VSKLGYPDLVVLAGFAGFGKSGNSNIMAAIAMAESGGDPAAHNSLDCRGLWQINYPVWQSDPAIAKLDLYKPKDNATAAQHVYEKQGYQAWTTYTSGAYKKYVRNPSVVEMAGAQANFWAGKWNGSAVGNVVSSVTGSNGITSGVGTAVNSALSGATTWLNSALLTTGVGVAGTLLILGGLYVLAKKGGMVPKVVPLPV
jgi:hypothetical protein